MEAWIAVLLERYEALTREGIELLQQRHALNAREKKNKREVEDIKRFLRGAVVNPSVKADYDRIGNLKKQLSATNGQRPVGGPNKTHAILAVLQKNNPDTGLELGEIMDLLIPYNLGINRNYVGTVLRKLQKSRNLVSRQGKKYILTEQGQSMKLST
jgi:predicted transcriptional regulator